MKHLMIVALVIVLCSPACDALAETSVDLQPLQDSVQAQIEELGLHELLDFAVFLDQDYQDFLPSLDWRDIFGGGSVVGSPEEFIALLLRHFFSELYLSLHLLRQLVVIGILAALLQRLSTSFGNKMVVDLAFAVCFLVLVLLGLQSFQLAASMAREAIDVMVEFMYALIPVLSTLLVAVGGVTSAAIFHPLLWVLVGTIAGVMRYIVLPLILFSTAFSLVAHFSADLAFPKLGSLLRQGVITLLGLIFIVFSGFMAVRGAIAPIADGISLRTAKYLTKTFIPIAGSMFADTLEVIVGGSLLIKNSVGIFGLVMVVLMVLTPLLKVWVMVVVYKVVGALLEPVSDQRIVQALGTMESSLILVAIALGTVAVMFFLSITILVGIGNLAVFMR